MKFLDHPPRFLFFTGKGGVGKTSIACASAIRLAEAGQRVLLVSTDPASNVGQAFGVDIGNRITAIPAVPRLAALESEVAEIEAVAQRHARRLAVAPLLGTEPVGAERLLELAGAHQTEPVAGA